MSSTVPDVPLSSPLKGTPMTNERKQCVECGQLCREIDSPPSEHLPTCFHAQVNERLRLAEAVVEAARKVDESRAALKRLNDEAYKLPTHEYERLGDIAYEHSARLEAMREALAAYDLNAKTKSGKENTNRKKIFFI